MIPLDAPTYPPATAYAPPTPVERPLTVRTYSAAELMQMPAAWAVVLKHLPGMKLMAGAEQARPMLTTMTVADFAQFTGGDASAALAAIDAELAQLPAGQGGAR